MYTLIGDLTDRSFLLASAKYFKGQCLCRWGVTSHNSGATVQRSDIETAVAYIQTVVNDYFQVGRLPSHGLRGLDLLEIGPGDNLGVALLLLAKGAQSVTCIDRFQPKFNHQRNKLVYEALLNGCSREERENVQSLMDPIMAAKSSGDGKLTVSYGQAIETMSPSQVNNRFDLILSRAVLEHVYNLEEAWEAMIRSLKPTGRMLHKIDFRNHKFFKEIHPLAFLTCSPWWWELISSPNPTLNRKRANVYRKLLSDRFEQHHIYITSILENGELPSYPTEIRCGEHYTQADLKSIDSIKSKLYGDFASLSSEDLLVSGVFIDCQNPVR